MSGHFIFIHIFLSDCHLGLYFCLYPALCFLFQEMLLKRAADLVEALYGTPHNNQVRCSYLGLHWICLFMLGLMLTSLPFCRTSFWSEPQILPKPSTVFPGTPARSRLSPALQLTVAWWASILTAASLGSASQSQPREIIKVRPSSGSKLKQLSHWNGWLCWSGKN